MAWNSGSFVNSFGSWLSNNDSLSENQTAEELSKLYSISAKTVNPKTPKWLSVPISLKSNSIINNGFLSSFNLAKELREGFTNPSIWVPAANSIIAYWTSVNFTLEIPAPGGLISTSNITVFPGDPIKLSIDLNNSFKQNDPFAVATSLNKTFQDHLKTVKGLWVGTAPGVPPLPLTVPWVGLD